MMEIFLLALVAFAIATLFGVRVLAWVILTPVVAWVLIIVIQVINLPSAPSGTNGWYPEPDVPVQHGKR